MERLYFKLFSRCFLVFTFIFAIGGLASIALPSPPSVAWQNTTCNINTSKMMNGFANVSAIIDTGKLQQVYQSLPTYDLTLNNNSSISCWYSIDGTKITLSIFYPQDNIAITRMIVLVVCIIMILGCLVFLIFIFKRNKNKQKTAEIEYYYPDLLANWEPKTIQAKSWEPKSPYMWIPNIEKPEKCLDSPFNFKSKSNVETLKLYENLKDRFYTSKHYLI